MQTFTDNAGRTWTVNVNVVAIKRVKTLLEVNLLDAVSGDLLARLATDPILLCDVIYVVCKPEADALGVSDEDFGRAMAGDAIDNAACALIDELVDFFPLAKRGLLRKALERTRSVEAKATALVAAKIESPEVENAIVEEIRKELDRLPGSSGGSSGGSPEPSG